MVDIEYRPVKKIVVHEIIRNELNDFLRIFAQPAMPNQPPSVARWIDGVLFTFVGFPPTPELINERARDGTIHWDNINFTELENYQQILNNPDNGAVLHVLDNSNNTAVSDFIRWLKKQPQWKTKSNA